MRSRLYRRKDSKYWWAEFTAPDGRTALRESTGCRDASSATDWLAARNVERQRAVNGVPTAQRIALDVALAEYLTLRRPFWSSGWYATVEGFARHDVIPWFKGETAVSDLTRPQVERFRAAMVGRPQRLRPGKNIGNATVNRLIAGLAKFGNWCADPARAYLLSNPFAGHKPLPEDDRPPPAITEEDFARWLSWLPERSRARGRPHVRAIVTVAVETGLRRGELGRLAWADVDLGERVAWVLSVKERGFTKGRKKRPVVLTALAVEALETLPRRQDGLVFGRVPDIRKSMRAAATKAGLGHVWFHAARHFGASLVGARGASDADLQAWGGWSSPRMVRRYDHSQLARLEVLAGRANVARNSHAVPTPKEEAGAVAAQPSSPATESVDPTGIEPVTF